MKRVIQFFKQKDKWYHISVCFTAALYSTELSVGLAIGKEYGDSKAHGNTWSWGDIIADAIGTIAGTIVRITILNPTIDKLWM